MVPSEERLTGVRSWSSNDIRLVDGHIDLSTRTVRRANTHKLTTMEAALVAYMAAHPGRDVSTELLLAEVWGYAPGVNTRAPYHTMRRLRAKIEQDPAVPRHLHTVYGIGYRFEPVGDDQASPTPVPMTRQRRSAALPGRGDSFVGRDAVLARVQEELQAGHLVTLTGPAGSGKTRLALEAAHGSDLTAIWVDATGATDLGTLIGAVRAAGDLPTPTDLSALARCIDALGPQLWVLDNLEQVVDAAAELIVALRQGAPTVQIIATSRVALRVAHERVTAVAPLGETDAVALLVDHVHEASGRT